MISNTKIYRLFFFKVSLPVSRSLLRADTLVDGVIINLGLRTTNLIQVSREITDQVLPTGCRVGEGGVSKGLTVRAQGVTLGTFKSLDILLDLNIVALLGKGRSLLLPDTGTLGFIED